MPSTVRLNMLWNFLTDSRVAVSNIPLGEGMRGIAV